MPRSALTRCARTAGAALLALAVAGVATAGAQAPKPNAENDPRRGPTQDLGLYLGFPTPTFQWHGCRLTASAATSRVRPQGSPRLPKGNRPRAVTFSRSASPPYIRWKVNRGWRICGVQMSATLRHPSVPYAYFASMGYTSSRTAGRTNPTGKERFTVAIPKNPRLAGGAPAELLGKRFTVGDVYDVTVFVKKA